jgi:hypothetical protein
MFISNKVHHSVRHRLANFVPANRVSIEAFCAMHPTMSVLDSADMLKRGDTDPWRNSSLKVGEEWHLAIPMFDALTDVELVWISQVQCGLSPEGDQLRGRRCG